MIRTESLQYGQKRNTKYHMKPIKIMAVLLLLSLCGPAMSQLKVKPNGYVGIGTNNPVSRLHIYGEGLVDSHAERAFWTRVHYRDAGSYYLWNSVYRRDVFFVNGSGWLWSMQGNYTGSDSSVMEQVTPIDSSLNIISQLNGVRFKYVDESGENGDSDRMGFVAQEVERVVPEVVRTFQDSTKAIAYDDLIPLLAEAIKEQQEQIESLRATITDHEDEIARLKKRRWFRK